MVKLGDLPRFFWFQSLSSYGHELIYLIILFLLRDYFFLSFKYSLLLDGLLKSFGILELEVIHHFRGLALIDHFILTPESTLVKRWCVHLKLSKPLLSYTSPVRARSKYFLKFYFSS